MSAISQNAYTDDLMTLDEAQKDYFKGKVSRWLLYRMCEAVPAQMPHIRVGSGKNGKILLRRSTLDEWFSEKEKQSVGQQAQETKAGVLRIAK